ncbi:MAG: cAMP-activated global transcriptional regulator CRP [SAR86 cluster bacterium]|uniref:cAMP-activated global transcriptional regulator CRP n=1 Tax=SAR86 cluster bacterium TaxID=2030880 RepID=A0A2A5CFQ9_9GAMM|nr:MAG: cAMP-activated global transcriptional regulator CRP [SAR86 cluster bacterium]
MSLLFDNLNFPDFDNFLSKTRKYSYPSNKLIFNEGEVSETLYFILSGSISVVLTDDNNREIIIAYLSQGDFFGEMSLFDINMNRSTSVRTKENTVLAEINYENFKKYADEYPQILYVLGKQMAQRLRNTTQKVADLSFLDATGRIASALLNLSKDPSAITHPDGMQIRITRQDLGKISNCSREMAGRILKDMQNQGLVKVSGKTIVIFGTR